MSFVNEASCVLRDRYRYVAGYLGFEYHKHASTHMHTHTHCCRLKRIMWRSDGRNIQQNQYQMYAAQTCDMCS